MKPIPWSSALQNREVLENFKLLCILVEGALHCNQFFERVRVPQNSQEIGELKILRWYMVVISAFGDDLVAKFETRAH